MKSTGQGVFDPGANPREQLKPTQGTIGRALLLAGLILLAVYAGYRIQGVALWRLAVQSFETAARLKNLTAGERAELLTYERTDPFVIDSVRVVNPRDVNVLRPGSPWFTLVTYYPLYFAGQCAATLYRPCIDS